MPGQVDVAFFDDPDAQGVSVAARIDTLEVDSRVLERLRRWIGMYTSVK